MGYFLRRGFCLGSGLSDVELVSDAEGMFQGLFAWSCPDPLFKSTESILIMCF